MTKKKDTPISYNGLIRRDLLTFEQELCKDLSQIVSFDGYALYFPTENELQKPTYIAEENKLLLPLLQDKHLLGIMLLRDVSINQETNFIDFLSAYVQICLDKLVQVKASQSEPKTGLMYSHLFIQHIEQEIRAVQQYFQRSDMQPQIPDNDQWQASVGLIALPILNLQDVRKQYGFVEAKNLFNASVKEAQNILPENALCASLRDDVLFVLLPGANREATEFLSKKLVNITASIRHPLTSSNTSDDTLTATFCAGYSIYPQNLDGRKRIHNFNDLEELAHILVGNAYLASSRLMEIQAAQHTLNFDKILSHGAQITEILSHSNLRIDIGAEAGAKKDMLFSIWSGDGLHYHGDIMLTKIEEKTSIGEIRIMGDPIQPIEKGDLLQYQAKQKARIAKTDAKNFLFFQDFFEQMHIQQTKSKNIPFCILLLRLNIEKGKTISKKIHKLIQSQLKNTFKDTAPSLMGIVSFNSLVIYHPGILPEDAQPQYEKIALAIEKELTVSIAIGIAHYPYLNYHISSMWDCARKALDYAVLLPYPHVGIFDSLAINISADRKYSQNDTYSAIEEYHLALLADEKNNLARNSLGICLASLGRHSEAHQIFSEAQNIDPTDVSTSYNLGTSSLSLKEYDKAKKAFHNCLEKEKHHIFARIRLGEIAENFKDYTTALGYYLEVQELFPESSLPLRCIARINLAQEKPDHARENLQGALQKNPNDPIALQMLADLYLEYGDDASLAEILARQSVALNPWRNLGWLTLSKALHALGKKKEASAVLKKMGTLS